MRCDHPYSRASVPLLVLIALAIATATATGQGVASFGAAAGQTGLSPPQFAPEGVWARVVSATPKWLVLENAHGQQFPVAAEAINLFVIRWPIDPLAADPFSYAEVTGVDLNNGQVVADQVDIYEGPNRALVTPTSQHLFGYNRVLTLVSPFQMNTFTQSGLLPGEAAMPPRRHVVGPLISAAPLVIGAGANSAVTVVPGGNGVLVTSVTPGSTALVAPGDLVWCLPAAANPRTLALSRLVVYKTAPVGPPSQ